MSRLRSAFWNHLERRPRALWRLLLYVGVVAAVANPLVLALDVTDVRLLEASLENVCIAMGFGAALVLSARYTDRRPLRDFGLGGGTTWWREFGIGCTVGGLLMGTVFVIAYAAGWVAVRGVAHTTIAAAPFALAAFGQVIRYAGGSFFEEVFSRSYLLRMLAETGRGAGMRRTRAVVLAALLTSMFFGGLHLLNPGASVLAGLNLTLLGLLFALPMIVTGRLGLSMGLHLGWNVAQNTVFGLPNGGKASQAALLVTEQIGPDTLTGGAFGPEGGLLTLAVLLAGLPLLGGWLRLRRGAVLATRLADAPAPRDE